MLNKLKYYTFNSMKLLIIAVTNIDLQKWHCPIYLIQSVNYRWTNKENPEPRGAG